MEDEGALLQVVDFAASYKRPIDYDDEVLVFTRVQERTKVAVTLEYRVERADTGELVATGSTRLACVSRHGRLQRLPPEI